LTDDIIKMGSGAMLSIFMNGAAVADPVAARRFNKRQPARLRVHVVGSLRRLRTAAGRILLAVMLAGFASLSTADQNAENLDKLFDELAAAEYPITAHQLESEIWRTWLDYDDSEVEEELRAGMRDMSAGDLEKSIEHFSRVIEMAPDFAEGWNKRATAYYYNGEPAKSMRDIQKTLSLEPRHFGAIAGMGMIFLQQGDERSALEAFEQVLKIHPMAPDAHAQAERLRKKLEGSGI
jgi:tetratricopeptide (TPR) repeat protein